MDDFPIGLAVLSMAFNGDVTDLNMSTGHRAFIEGIDDISFRAYEDFSSEHRYMLNAIHKDHEHYMSAEWRNRLAVILEKVDQKQSLTEQEEKLIKAMLSIVVRENETLKSDKNLAIRDTVFLRSQFYDHTDEFGERILGKDPSCDEVDIIYKTIEQKWKEHRDRLVLSVPVPDDPHPDYRATYRVFEQALKKFTKQYNADIPVILFEVWPGKANIYNFVSKDQHNLKFQQASELSKAELEFIRLQNMATGITAGELVCTEFGASPDCTALGGSIIEGLKVFWFGAQNIEEVDSLPAISDIKTHFTNN